MLTLVERPRVTQGHTAGAANGFGNVVKQQCFTGARSGREQEKSAGMVLVRVKDIVFDRLLGGSKKIFSLQKTRGVAKGRDQIIGRDKKLVRIGIGVKMLAAENAGNFCGIAGAQAAGAGLVGVETIFVHIGKEMQRLSKKAKIMVIGAHLPQDFLFFVGSAQRCFEFDVDNAVIAEAQQIKFFADAVNGITAKKPSNSETVQPSALRLSQKARSVASSWLFSTL